MKLETEFALMEIYLVEGTAKTFEAISKKLLNNQKKLERLRLTVTLHSR